MTNALPSKSLNFPCTMPPTPGEVLEVVHGLSWIRRALPLRLDHLNMCLLEDGIGYAAIDSGIGDESAENEWDLLLGSFLRLRRGAQVADHVTLNAQQTLPSNS